MGNKIKSLKSENAALYNNVLAYEQEHSSLNDKIYQFELTTARLNNSRDSITQKLNETRKELKIKDKQIKQLQYIASQVSIRDTIHVVDTVFRESVHIDTTLSKPWYTVGLSLSYPNTIGVDVSVPSEKQVVISTKKEIINPSKSCLVNIFKKKQIVTEVEVIESNPYITSKQNRFIEITHD